MKKFIFTCIISSVMGVLSTSCELEETLYSQISSENFYQTSGDAEAAITAAYGPLVDMYNAAVHGVSDFSADQIYPRPVVARNTFTLFSYDANYSAQKSFNRFFESPQQIWQSSYSGIEKCNWVLAKVPEITMDETRKSEILGEAFFLRAYYHWMLTKNFGNVIVKTQPSMNQDEAYTAISDKAAIYEQIYNDLQDATNLLPTFDPVLTEKGRPSKEAAMALHAKAALYSEDYPLALEKAKAVIESQKYGLMPNVVDVFDVSKEDEARMENIWSYEVERTVPGSPSQVPSLYGPPGSAGLEYGNSSFGSAFAYQSFYDSFNPLDERRKLLDTTYVNRAGEVVPQNSITPITPNGVLVRKFRDPDSDGGRYAVNLTILRLADVYLIAAEAEARANGVTETAYDYIDAVRNRSNLPDLERGLTEEQFIDAVLQERSWELFGEADRWYDLTRTGKFLTVIPNAVNEVFPARSPQPKHKYFPIPEDEVNANDLIEQNPDWQ